MLFLNLSKLQSEELLKTFMNHKTQRKGTVFGIMVSDIMSADCTSPLRNYMLTTIGQRNVVAFVRFRFTRVYDKRT